MLAALEWYSFFINNVLFVSKVQKGSSNILRDAGWCKIMPASNVKKKCSEVKRTFPNGEYEVRKVRAEKKERGPIGMTLYSALSFLYCDPKSRCNTAVGMSQILMLYSLCKRCMPIKDVLLGDEDSKVFRLARTVKKI